METNKGFQEKPAPQQPTLAQLGMREIIKAAANALVPEIQEFIDRERAETKYVGSSPLSHPRRGRSNANEVSGSFISKYENRVQAIREYITKEFNITYDVSPDLAKHTDTVVFRSLYSEFFSPEEVLLIIEQRMGWIAEHSERL